MAGSRPETTQPVLVAPDGDDPLLGSIRHPEGWSVSILTELPGSTPIALQATAAGDLFVAVHDRSSKQGRILLLEGTNWSGKAGEVHEFVPQLENPRGLEWDGEWLYVVNPPQLIAVRDTDGDQVADQDRVLVEGLGNARGLTLGIDGWLYLATGDSETPQATGTDGSLVELREGGVLRVRPDGTKLQVYSRGTHGVEQVAVSPLLDVFAAGAANEEVGWESRLLALTGLDHHGYSLLCRNFGEEIMPPISKRPSGSGGAVAFSDRDGEESGVSIITADSPAGTIRQRTIETKADSALPRETADSRLMAIESPAGVDIDATGKLFVLGGKDALVTVFHPLDSSDPPSPPGPSIPTPSLISQLQQTDRIRSEIQQEILRRSLTLTDLDTLETLASDRSAELAPRIAALFTMKLGFAGEANARLAGLGEDPDLLPFVLRALGDFPDQANNLPPALFAKALKSDDLRTQREAVLAVARLKLGEFFPDLARLAVSEDSALAHIAITALVELRDIEASFEILDEFENYKIWPGVFRSLARIHDIEVVDGLVSRLEKTDSSLFRSGAIRTLARLYHRESDERIERSAEDRSNPGAPFFNPEKWEGTVAIDGAIRKALRDKRVNKTFLFHEISRNRIPYDDFSSLLSITAVTPDLEEPTVTLILEQDEPPLDSLPFLTYIATSELHPGDLRLRAAIALARSSDDMAAQSAFRLTLERDTIGGTPQLQDSLLATLLNNVSHDQRHDWLLEEAHGPDDDDGILAWEILLEMEQSGDALGTPARSEIRNAVDRAPRNPRVLRRLLLAIAEAEWQRGNSLVRDALDHSDRSIADAAAEAAATLELDHSSE